MYQNNPTPQRQAHCDNCGRFQRVAEVILHDESGFADYCFDCITNSKRQPRKMCGKCATNPKYSIFNECEHFKG